MADMYGFACDGELQAIKAYLLSHELRDRAGNTSGGGFTTRPFGQSTQSITAFLVILRSLVVSLIWSLVIYDRLCQSLFFRLRAMEIASSLQSRKVCKYVTPALGEIEMGIETCPIIRTGISEDRWSAGWLIIEQWSCIIWEMH